VRCGIVIESLLLSWPVRSPPRLLRRRRTYLGSHAARAAERARTSRRWCR